jgi:hypothetical protein
MQTSGANSISKQFTVMIQGALTFNSDATYTYSLKARGNQARTDLVIAHGVTLKGGCSAI